MMHASELCHFPLEIPSFCEKLAEHRFYCKVWFFSIRTYRADACDDDTTTLQGTERNYLLYQCA